MDLGDFLSDTHHGQTSRRPSLSSLPHGDRDEGSSHLSYYLSELATKPNVDPQLVFTDLHVNDVGSALTTSHKRTESNNLPLSQAPSSNSLASLADRSDPPVVRPDADAFVYIETLLESLAVLGQLGSALDSVTQRVATEIHALVETTLDEVQQR